MPLRPGPIQPGFEETARVARAALRTGNSDPGLRDGLGPIFAGADLAA